MNPFATGDERLMQLLADEATEGLSGSGHHAREEKGGVVVSDGPLLVVASVGK